MAYILGLVNYTLILIYGAVISLNFSGYEKTRKNRIAIVLMIFLILLLQMVVFIITDYIVTSKLYPLIVHLPLILFIERYMKRPCSIAIVSVLTAYLCCQPPNWLGIAMHFLLKSEEAFFLGNSLGILIMLYLIRRFVAPSVNQVMSYSKRSLYIFGSFPFLYYLFDYSTTVYTEFLYSGVQIVAEFFPSILSMFYIVFVMVYSHEMRERNQLELNNAMLEAQSERAMNEIFALQQVQKQTAIYRHDMRHHLSLLYSYLEAGDGRKAMEYICQAQDSIDRIVPARYCENNTVNLILSFFVAKAEQSGVSLDIEVELPNHLPFPDTELCTLLSNGLENAVTAAAKDSDSNPGAVRLNCGIHKGNLLILIENAFGGKVVMKNGLPQTHEEGHGYGAKSIAMLAEKYSGYYSFALEEGLFTLKVVLPMKS